MKIFAQTGFGELVTQDWLARAKSIAHGARGVIPIGSSDTQIRKLVRNFKEAEFVDQIWIIAPWEMMSGDSVVHELPDDWRPAPEATALEAGMLARRLKREGLEESSWIEIGPEVDIDGFWKQRRNWTHFTETVFASYNAIRAESSAIRIVTGSVANLASAPWWKPWERKGREFLEKLAAANFPIDTYQGVHPYRTTRPAQYFEGFDSPQEAIAWVLATLAPRIPAITEIGWHNGEQTEAAGPFGICERTTEFDEVETAGYTDRDIAIWAEAGSPVYNHYAIRDGRPDDPDHGSHYGAFHADGTPKPVADVLAHWKHDLESI